MTTVKPMLAETGKHTDLDREDWLYEQKLDGVRCIAFLDGTTKLQARSGNDITARFPELANLHKQVTKPCIVDGEIIGRNFNSIQHRIHQQKPLAIKIAQKTYPVIYCIFDILNINGDSIMSKPLIERKGILSSTFVQDYSGRVLNWQTGRGRSLFEATADQELEGIMAKAIYSQYYEGKRSTSWLKVKHFKEASFYICGLTEGENERATTFGSVILGERINGHLEYVGNVGSGFNHNQLNMMLSLLETYKGDSVFETIPKIDRPVKFWTKPELRCEVRYLEKSPEGKLRFPTFRKLEHHNREVQFDTHGIATCPKGPVITFDDCRKCPDYHGYSGFTVYCGTQITKAMLDTRRRAVCKACLDQKCLADSVCIDFLIGD